MLRDMAMAWVRANCPHRKVQQDFAKQLDSAAGRGMNCSFTVGAGLTKTGKPYLVHCFGDDLFIFELTPRQAASLRVKENMLTAAIGRPHRDPDQKPPVSLERLEIDAASGLKHTELITGRCWYETPWRRLLPCGLRLDYELPGARSVSCWHYLPDLAGPQGAIRFSFPPIGRSDEPAGEAFSGPLAAFVRLFMVPDSRDAKGRWPVSNACAVVLDIH